MRQCLQQSHTQETDENNPLPFQNQQEGKEAHSLKDQGQIKRKKKQCQVNWKYQQEPLPKYNLHEPVKSNSPSQVELKIVKDQHFGIKRRQEKQSLSDFYTEAEDSINQKNIKEVLSENRAENNLNYQKQPRNDINQKDSNSNFSLDKINYLDSAYPPQITVSSLEDQIEKEEIPSKMRQNSIVNESCKSHLTTYSEFKCHNTQFDGSNTDNNYKKEQKEQQKQQLPNNQDYKMNLCKEIQKNCSFKKENYIQQLPINLKELTTTFSLKSHKSIETINTIRQLSQTEKDIILTSRNEKDTNKSQKLNYHQSIAFQHQTESSQQIPSLSSEQQFKRNDDEAIKISVFANGGYVKNCLSKNFGKLIKMGEVLEESEQEENQISSPTKITKEIVVQSIIFRARLFIILNSIWLGITGLTYLESLDWLQIVTFDHLSLTLILTAKRFALAELCLCALLVLVGLYSVIRFCLKAMQIYFYGVIFIIVIEFLVNGILISFVPLALIKLFLFIIFHSIFLWASKFLQNSMKVFSQEYFPQLFRLNENLNLQTKNKIKEKRDEQNFEFIDDEKCLRKITIQDDNKTIQIENHENNSNKQQINLGTQISSVFIFNQAAELNDEMKNKSN